jgi:uncharacterized membrane protein
MHFAPLLPVWLLAALGVAAIAAAFAVYRRPLAPLTRGQRGTLIALRAAALLLVLLFILRPIVLRPPAASGDIVVPILVDVSRSMNTKDDGRDTRLARAERTISDAILPGLSKQFVPELYAFGATLAPTSLATLHADANHTDLTGAVAAVADRYRGRRVAGIVLVSDGGDTGHDGVVSLGAAPPVFAVGVGSPSGPPDREVAGMTAGDPRLDQASIDLHLSIVSRGFGRAPFDVRVSANGRPLDTRHVTPAADGAPIEEVLTVSPDLAAATVYTAEVVPDASELVTGNNTRSVLVNPRSRKRRVLILEGAPGFDHSFLTRALAGDPDLEIDSIVRKGKNDAGQDTFLVQAAAGRAPSLTSGFPARREDLFSYDAVVMANVAGDSLTRAQLASVADFVATRGGGLLVFGGLSFAEHGLIGTPLETVMPVELNDRRGGLVRTSYGADLGGPRNTVVLTPEGEAHPVMRIGSSPEDTRKKWAALPPLAGSAPLGGPRAGATVLAVTSGEDGAVYPVVAVQAYGEGRSMVFGGEAAWRWRMMAPLTDRSYEFFWRQAVRWLAGPAPDPVAVTVPEASQPGDAVTLRAIVRDAAFEPVLDASIGATLVTPSGATVPVAFRRESGADGRFTAAVRADDTGVYRLRLEATRGALRLGAADRSFYVGGSDPELADPRLNEGALRRIARTTGGRYVPASGAADIASWLAAAAPRAADLEPHDLWQAPWAFALVIGILGAEWSLRRRWGLR